ncbi:hypothetical protein BCR34DRAFT_194987 [Clohesyomyces aquaticus]|uniref:Uncharacterized protein n=1 Tax=Clohesyomyces aquaticus TaxID=1231657 RepID=A0A1Y1YBZ9_9PLEO|nr:hypothetical protein BCR34DRAFT_194987 [Clohesyomyces aquaticus]
MEEVCMAYSRGGGNREKIMFGCWGCWKGERTPSSLGAWSIRRWDRNENSDRDRDTTRGQVFIDPYAIEERLMLEVASFALLSAIRGVCRRVWFKTVAVHSHSGCRLVHGQVEVALPRIQGPANSKFQIFVSLLFVFPFSYPSLMQALSRRGRVGCFGRRRKAEGWAFHRAHDTTFT